MFQLYWDEYAPLPTVAYVATNDLKFRITAPLSTKNASRVKIMGLPTAKVNWKVNCAHGMLAVN